MNKHNILRVGAACMGLAAALSAPCARADSITKLNGFLANSVQTFSPEASLSFALMGIKFKPLGNTSSALGSFIMPITETTYGASKYKWLGTSPIAGGSIGAALSIERTVLTGAANPRLTLANFRTDYHTKMVYADATIAGQKTVAKVPIYTFNVARPMAQEVNEEGLLSLDEKLDQLKLTPEGMDLFVNGLKLPTWVRPIMQAMKYGTLVQTVVLLPRLTPVPDSPYVPL